MDWTRDDHYQINYLLVVLVHDVATEVARWVAGSITIKIVEIAVFYSVHGLQYNLTGGCFKRFVSPRIATHLHTELDMSTTLSLHACI